MKYTHLNDSCQAHLPVHFALNINSFIRGRLDLAVLFTPSTPNRQNRNQVRWNICAGVRRSTPSFKVVQTEQSRDLFQKRWRIIACMCGNILYRLIYSGVLQSAQFYLFMWLFWRTRSTLKIAKSSPPQKWHWWCDWQLATPESCKTSFLFVPSVSHVLTGCSAFSFYTPAKPLLRSNITLKTVIIAK